MVLLFIYYICTKLKILPNSTDGHIKATVNGWRRGLCTGIGLYIILFYICLFNYIFHNHSHNLNIYIYISTFKIKTNFKISNLFLFAKTIFQKTKLIIQLSLVRSVVDDKF